METVCGRLLEYNIHKERKDWTRFARGKSETFQALDGLVAKGVKVDIGIPNELWHKPSAEITHLKNQCEVRYKYKYRMRLTGLIWGTHLKKNFPNLPIFILEYDRRT